MSAQLPVLIIGAGLAGLTVARALLKSKIPAIVFEQASAGRSPGYGLTLRSTAHRPLLELLSIDETTFKQRVAVDATIGGTGRVQKHLDVDARQGKIQQQGSGANSDNACRVNKRRLRDLLAENVDIRWEHKFKSLQIDTDNVTATFENGETVKGSLLVAADGVHSLVREQVLPDLKPEVLPYVVINGQRKYSKEDFEAVFHPILKQTASVYSNVDGKSLGISINDSKADEVNVSYTYSRLPRDGDDPLYTPNRSKEEAKTIPTEFFEELQQIGKLCQPFKSVFDPEACKKDKLLSWLMRSTRPSTEQIAKLPKTVILLGDAAHAAPIVAGVGGEQAIRDGVDLGKAIAADKASTFSSDALTRWTEGIEESERDLHSLHTQHSKL